jgi:signal transduction histidine kinase
MGQSRVLFVLLLFAVLVAGGLVGWVRSQHDESANGLRGRVRLEPVGWALGALALTAAVLVTGRLQQVTGNGGNRWLILVLVVAAALLLALRPGLAYRVTPVLMIVLGLAAFVIARNKMLPGSGFAPGYYGLGGVELGFVLGYVFVVLGGWLAWRSRDPLLGRARLLLGRVTELSPRAQFRALLLLPVAIMAAEVSTSPDWRSTSEAALWLALFVAAAVVVLRRWPGAAARLTVAGLLLLGLAGIVLSTAYRFWAAPREYGLIVLAGQTTPGLILAQGLVLLAFAAWLVPQTFPSTRRLLGLPPDPELTRQVRQLTESRAVVVDTASSDLRRLERDLHDGAQARLVALGMSLRAAERLIPVNPDAAAALVAEARDTSARALTELRELVRGVHPPVLADRGLADAIRALALDCPLAVETRVDLPGRPPGPIETACYFAVAELLTNAVKHSGARGARIDASHQDRLLRIEVTDFGLGGANPAVGSGLSGVEKRLAAFDGIMAISSPAGGPTIVVLEVPCVLSSPKTSSC